jgi:hypothetical protein
MEFYRRGRNLGEGVVEVLQLPNHLSVGMQMRELQGPANGCAVFI